MGTTAKLTSEAQQLQVDACYFNFWKGCFKRALNVCTMGAALHHTVDLTKRSGKWAEQAACTEQRQEIHEWR